MSSSQKRDLSHASNPIYLRQQYGDAERLNIRREAHRLYTENRQAWDDWVMAQVAPMAGETIADIGCGPGTYHAQLADLGAHVVGMDSSYGMLIAARGETEDGDLPASLAQANAEALPLQSASVDCVMANHMLYHVADQHAALLEMRRVLRPGGRILVITNSADANQRLYQLHRDAARTVGYQALPTVVAAFDGSHGFRVERVFPHLETYEYVDAFRFPSTETALRYYASAMIDSVADRPIDDRHRALLLEEMARRMDAIIASEGILHVPKGAICFRAMKA